MCSRHGKDGLRQEFLLDAESKGRFVKISTRAPFAGEPVPSFQGSPMFLGEAVVAVMPYAQIQQYPWGSIAASFVGSDSSV